jgi:uncharacterized protein YndB with AHSA1/START domain
MIQHEVSIHLNHPVEQVFAFLIDPDNLCHWQSKLIETELLTGKPLRVGTRFREVRRMGRRQAEIRGEITAYEPNKHFATKTLSKPQASVSYTFEPENSGTRLSYKFVLQTSGFMRFLEPVITGSIKKDFNSDFERLKHVLENAER